MVDQETYRKWLRAAYLYYCQPGTDTGMSDYEWDFLAKEIAKTSEKFDELKGQTYDGGSLFWLKCKDYPDWVKEKSAT